MRERWCGFYECFSAFLNLEGDFVVPKILQRAKTPSILPVRNVLRSEIFSKHGKTHFPVGREKKREKIAKGQKFRK